ncbi:hypothetical protein BCR24_05020 [Enterococcus ureilyticus]|uniref:Uncharacterized protein n=1 Tax=Enterococcus ureilyticus TaxID=1131292 RepID=A0A1E5HB63_9ENTE|nr:hypothetical protein [Enterococcus ureilyticus]MBM7690293.1 hypothetical protein [Enterococcus ureilyticus]MBO0447696.1 hypothetical protein [Enterococcus ureilyticus]OEG22066.1 hypothetical protein BCR24_05020 [Enterococcus ureilyticus]
MESKKRIKKISGIIFLILTILCLLFLGGFVLVSSKGIELISDWFLLAAIIGSFLFLGLTLLCLMDLDKKRKIYIILLQIAAIITVSALFSFVKPKEKAIISLSPDAKHVFLVKETSDDQGVYYFNNYYLILARLKEKLPTNGITDYRLTWLTNETCVLTYRSKDQAVHQYIGTYGGRKIAYSYVLSALIGVWESKDGDTSLTSSASEGIVIQEVGEREKYSFEQTVQFGTTALTINDDTNARWSISLDSENKYDEYGDIVQNAQTKIILLKAGFDDPQKIELYFKRSSE